MSKIAFACTLSDNYIPLFKNLINSILRNNPGFDLDYFVFCDNRLSEYNRALLKCIYDRLIFRNIDSDLYFQYNKGNIKYFSIECFALNGYDRVIFQGADMLCIGNINPILEFECDIGMNKERRRPGSFNNGNMIVSSKYINHETYVGLLDADYSAVAQYGTDQKLYNQYFRGLITETPLEFNTLVTEVGYTSIDKVIFLHYIHKPTHKKGREFYQGGNRYLMDIWHEYKPDN